MDSGGCYHASIDCAVDVYGSDVGDPIFRLGFLHNIHRS